MALYSTYDMVGQAEDVSDVISNISPTETPFLTMIGRGKIDARLYEWQEDALAAPAANAVPEGADAVDATLAPTTMRANGTQILSGTVLISGTADAVKTYGRDKESAYQLAKKGKELKRDLEFALVGAVQSYAVGTELVARTFGNVFGNDASSPAPVAMITAATNVFANGGVNRALTEAIMLDAHEDLFTLGADVSVWMVPPAHARTIAGFANATGTERTRDMGSSKKITNVVEVYQSPYGTLRVVMNRWLMVTAGPPVKNHNLLIDPEQWQLVTLRPWQKTLLAKTGDSNKWQLLTEVGLKHRNYAADGWITDLS